MHALFRRLAEARHEIELVRDYKNPINKVWAALTTPARIEDWMGVEWLSDRDAPLKDGGPFNYRFNNSGMETNGTVLSLERPRLLRHSWFDNTGDGSIVTWRLDPLDDGCRLTLTHRLPMTEEAPRTAAGWTMIMGGLEAWLDGVTFIPDRTWRQARDDYAERFGPEATRDGRLVEIDGEKTIRFERSLNRPVERIWAALTTPQDIKGWLQATAEIDPRVGGRIHLIFHSSGDHRMTGGIRAFDPPRLSNSLGRKPRRAGRP
jgi:uncharacterized protein YndB with AHSA1/START domain